MRRLWLGLIVLPVMAAGHRALLPRPQEVRYTSGSLSVQGLAIRFASTPTAEDRFAAAQLSAGLPGTTIRESGASGPAIVLHRAGGDAPLAGVNDAAGPDSRESYRIRVTPQGGEIQARTSAGLFYGVQTLLQMVEGAGNQAALPAVEVRDWPSLAYRGFMMDTSHGQLLRVEEIERQIDHLA